MSRVAVTPFERCGTRRIDGDAPSPAKEAGRLAGLAARGTATMSHMARPPVRIAAAAQAPPPPQQRHAAAPPPTQPPAANPADPYADLPR